MKKEVEVTHEELYKEITYLGRILQAMGSIVQNDMPCPPKLDLLSWAHDMNEIVERTQQAKKDVLRFYLEKCEKEG
jgi:hypothetical protein